MPTDLLADPPKLYLHCTQDRSVDATVAAMGSIGPAASASGLASSASPPQELRRRRKMVPRLTTPVSKGGRGRGGGGDSAENGGHCLEPLAGSGISDSEDEDNWTADEVVCVDKEPLLGVEVKTRTCEGGEEVKDAPAVEPLWSIAIQVFVPFLIAGFGTVGAGLVLDVIQVWHGWPSCWHACQCVMYFNECRYLVNCHCAKLVFLASWCSTE